MKLHPIRQKGLTMTALDEQDHKINSINLNDLLPGVYNGIVIRIDEGKHILTLSSDMNRERFMFWKKTPGGLFSRDALRYTRQKSNVELLLVEGKKYITAVRLINEDEIEEFSALKMLHGKIKDTYYMHLKTVKSDKSIQWHNGYINITENKNEFEEAEEALTKEAANKTKKTGPLFK